MAPRPRWLPLIYCMLATCSALAYGDETAGQAPTEYQVKAVFVYNFAHFVAWPAATFAAANQPFVIGVLGDDPFGSHLSEAVRGERIDQHPLVIRHYRDVADVSDCQILFIDQSQNTQLTRVVTALAHRSTLTVSDLQDASRRGVMIQFDTQNSRVALRINADSARAAGLTISSSLLQLAQIVRAAPGVGL